MDSLIIERGGDAERLKNQPPLRKDGSMKAETEGKIKYGIWGLICGVIAAIVVGFAWGGWVTAGTNQKMSDTAVLASQAAICVAQYVKEPNSQEKLKEFEAIDSYKRYEFIEKGGWDKMPGQKEASSGVAIACAEGLEALIKK